MELATEQGGFHGSGWIAGKPRITANAINGQGPEPDARYAVIHEVDSSAAFIRPFEDSVVRCGLAGGCFVDRVEGIARTQDGSGARVDDAGESSSASRLKDVQRAEDVH